MSLHTYTETKCGLPSSGQEADPADVLGNTAKVLYQRPIPFVESELKVDRHMPAIESDGWTEPRRNGRGLSKSYLYLKPNGNHYEYRPYRFNDLKLVSPNESRAR